MRIVAGQWGGRRLVAPPGRATRPTSDRVREALFAMLDSRGAVRDARVLDLFAGSGALGLEALSRGARGATFVDSSRAAIRAIEANLDALDADARVLRSDVRVFLRRARDAREAYDLVLIDPPYRDAPALAGALTEALPTLLASGALVVCESDRRSPLALAAPPLIDERRYGDTLIHIHGTSAEADRGLSRLL